jgi:hypothetical protein
MYGFSGSGEDTENKIKIRKGGGKSGEEVI